MLACNPGDLLRLTCGDRVDERLVRGQHVVAVVLARRLSARLRALGPLPLLLGPQALERANGEDQRLVAARRDQLLVELAGDGREQGEVVDRLLAPRDVVAQLRDDRLLAV